MVWKNSGRQWDPSRPIQDRHASRNSTAAELQQFVCAVNWMPKALLTLLSKYHPCRRSSTVC